MKKDSTIGVVREGDGLSWARASRARPGEPAACGAGAPPGGSEGLTLALSTSDVLFKALLVPTANPEEVAVIARNQMELEAPLEPERMVFAHETLRRQGEGTLVLAAAAPLDAVEAMREAAGADAARIVRVDAAALGFARALLASPAAAESGRQPVLFEEDGRLSLLLLEDRAPVLVRSLGAAASATAASLRAALRLALLQAEMDRGPAPAAPLLLAAGGSALLAAATAAASASGRELRTAAPATLAPAAFGAALRTLEGSGFSLYPEAWTAALSDRRWRRTFALSAGAAAAVWLALALALFGWPALLSSRIKSLQAEAKRLEPAEAAVDEVRTRIAIIDRYSDRTYSPLEVLREVSLAMPEDVTLAQLRYDAARRQAEVDGVAHSSPPAYELSNRLRDSPLFARNDFVTGPSKNANTDRTTFTLRLLFAAAEGEGDAPGDAAGGEGSR